MFNYLKYYNEDIKTILGMNDLDITLPTVPGYIPKEKKYLRKFVHEITFSSIFCIKKKPRKYEIKLIVLTKSNWSEDIMNTEVDDNFVNLQDMIKSEMMKRLESFISVFIKEEISKKQTLVEKSSIMDMFLSTSLFTFSKPSIAQNENKYEISIYIEQQREATESEESIELSVWFGDTKIHLIDMIDFEKVRREDLVSHSLLSASYCHSRDTQVENLLNSTRAYINRAIDNIQFVVPVDIQYIYCKQKSEQLSDNYSFIAFLFTLTNLMSFSGLRTCLTQFNNTTESLKRFHELYRISKQFRGAITLLRKYDKKINELFQLWTIPGGQELDCYDFIINFKKNKLEKVKIKEDTSSCTAKTSFITLNPFPFRTRRSTKLNDNLSGKETDFTDSLNYKRVVYNIYDLILFIISKKTIKEIKGQSYNINNFSGQSTNDPWKIESRNNQKEEPTVYDPQNISNRILTLNKDNSIHQNLDELVNEARKNFSSLIEHFFLSLITFEIMNYTFTPVEIPDDLPDEIFVSDKISQQRYKNIVEYFRTIQKLSFKQYDCQYQNSNDPIWRAFIHLDLLITFFDVLASILVRTRAHPSIGKKTILNITCLIEDLNIIINSCIDDTCSTYQLDLPIAIECNQDLLFKKLIKKELEWKELSRFTNRYATECSLLENLQLFNIFSNCYPELIEMCKNSSVQ